MLSSTFFDLLFSTREIGTLFPPETTLNPEFPAPSPYSPESVSAILSSATSSAERIDGRYGIAAYVFPSPENIATFFDLLMSQTRSSLPSFVHPASCRTMSPTTPSDDTGLFPPVDEPSSLKRMYPIPSSTFQSFVYSQFAPPSPPGIAHIQRAHGSYFLSWRT